MGEVMFGPGALVREPASMYKVIEPLRRSRACGSKTRGRVKELMTCCHAKITSW